MEGRQKMPDENVFADVDVLDSSSRPDIAARILSSRS
jgi:hypothetical protein